MAPIPYPQPQRYYPDGFPPPHTHSHEHSAFSTFILDFIYWIFKSRSYPKPHTTDWDAESSAFLDFLERSWQIILILLGACLALIAVLVVTIRCCIFYDRYQARYGEVGRDLGRREMGMVRACEARGRLVMQRMEKERLERIWREEDKRQAVRDEYLRKRSIARGKLPNVGRMERLQEEAVGREPIPGVGEGPAPRPSLERMPSKRKQRRGQGTQMLSDEDDTLRKRVNEVRFRGAEGRIGNSVWRSASYKSIQRATEQPLYWYGIGSSKELMRSVPVMRSEPSEDSECISDPDIPATTAAASEPLPLLQTRSAERPKLSIDTYCAPAASQPSPRTPSLPRPKLSVITHFTTDAADASQPLPYTQSHTQDGPRLSFDRERAEVLEVRREGFKEGKVDVDLRKEGKESAGDGDVESNVEGEENLGEKGSSGASFLSPLELVFGDPFGAPLAGLGLEVGEQDGGEGELDGEGTPYLSAESGSAHSAREERNVEVGEPLLGPSFGSGGEREAGRVDVLGERLVVLPRLSFDVPGGWEAVGGEGDEGVLEREGAGKLGCAPQ